MMTEQPESFGRYARRCRKQAGVSLYLLGKATGLAPAEIQAVERDQARPPADSQLGRWATALQVDPAEFHARAAANATPGSSALASLHPGGV